MLETKKKIKRLLFEDSINNSVIIIMVASIIVVLVSFWGELTIDRLFSVTTILGIVSFMSAFNIRKHFKKNIKQ